jgi:flagellin
LQFFGDKTAFTVSAGAMTGAAAHALTAGGTASTDGSDGVNNNLSTITADAFTPTAGSLTFTVNGTAVAVNLTASDTIDVAQQKVNQALNAYGVYAVQESSSTPGTNELVFESSSSFSVNADVAGVGGMAAAGTVDSLDPTSTATAAQNSISALAQLETAVNNLGAVQGKVGTGQNQLQYAVNLANSQISSFSAAESRIRDADVAAEAANLTKAQVLQQSSLAALAQANQQPQALLSLIKNA